MIFSLQCEYHLQLPHFGIMLISSHEECHSMLGGGVWGLYYRLVRGILFLEYGWYVLRSVSVSIRCHANCIALEW